MSDDARDRDDSYDRDNDLPPPSDPESEPGYPEVSPEERQRRGAILYRPEIQALIRTIATAQVKRWSGEAVDDACNAAEAEALIVPDFPTDEDEILAFIRRLAERVAKREQRGQKSRRKRRTSLTGHEPIVAHPYFGPSEEAERDERDAAHRAALAGVSRERGFKMLYARIVHKKSAADVAAEFNVSVKAYYAATQRLKRDARGLIAAVVVASIFLFGGRAYLKGPQNTVAHDDTPSSYDRAVAIAKEGRKECDQGEWAHCLELLDEAATVDPSIREWKNYEPLHAAAVEALKPPKVDDTPPPDDRKGPEKKAPKGPKAPEKGPDKKAPTP
jgi:hypothetical protein